MIPSVSRAEAEQHVRQFYERTWRDWYAGRSEPKLAAIVFHWDETGTTGYTRSADEIHFFGDEADREDIALEEHGQQRLHFGPLGWPVWKTYFVHEMLHEYQFKALSCPTPEGKALLSRQNHNFDGPGHDALFYSAIVDRAPYFGVTPEELLAEL